MADIDPIVVQISAEFGELRRDLAEVQKEVKSVGDSSKKSAKGVEMLGKALDTVAVAATATAAATGILIAKQLEAARSTELWARRLGIASTSFSQLAAVGARFGAEMDDVGDAIKDLNERIADAASGNKTYEEALNKVGLASKDLINLPVEAQFLKVADAIGKLNNVGDQNFVTAELMADAGFRLIPMFQQGEKAIRKMTAEVVKSNEALSEFDAQQLSQVNKSLEEMSRSITALGNALSIHLAPGLKLAAEWAKELADAAKDALGVSESSMKERLAEVNEELEKMGKVEMGNFRRGSRAYTRAMGKYRSYIALIQERAQLEGALASQSDTLATSTDKETEAIKKKTDAIFDLNSAMTEMMGGAAVGSTGENLSLTDINKSGGATEGPMAIFPQPEELEAQKGLLYESIIDYQENEFVIKAEHNARLAEQEQSLQDWLFQIDKDAKDKNAKLWESGWKGKQEVTSKFLGQISGLMNTNSRKQFEIGKAAAMAQVAIDTPKAAMSAYSAMSGIPIVGPALGAVAAAAAIASGVGQIQKIRSQSFGGGAGGVSGVFGDGGAGAQAGGGEVSPQNVVDATFQIEGSGGISQDSFRGLVGALNDELDDGAVLRSVNVI